jgi:hypothetical protein
VLTSLRHTDTSPATALSFICMFQPIRARLVHALNSTGASEWTTRQRPRTPDSRRARVTLTSTVYEE